METEDEIRGKAFVHWRSCHEAYPGLVSWDYLDNFTLERAEKMAFSWTDGILVAKDGGRVIGFVGYGDRGEEAPMPVRFLPSMCCRSTTEPEWAAP